MLYTSLFCFKFKIYKLFFLRCILKAWLLFIFPKITLGEILRLSNCSKMDAKFSQVNNGYKLVGSLVAAFDKINGADCVKKCLNYTQCKSINFHFERSLCELIKKNIEDEGASLEKRKGWSHVETPRTQQKVSLLDHIQL